MYNFPQISVPFMQMHDFLMQLHCKCIAETCNCIANAFFGQRKENFPPHPLYKEKKKIKKRKLKKERFLHQVSQEPSEVKKPNGPEPRARGNKKSFPAHEGLERIVTENFRVRVVPWAAVSPPLIQHTVNHSPVHLVHPAAVFRDVNLRHPAVAVSHRLPDHVYGNADGVRDARPGMPGPVR